MNVNCCSLRFILSRFLRLFTYNLQGAPGKPNEHIQVYGTGYKERLTGAHETSRFDQFTYGIANRGLMPWMIMYMTMICECSCQTLVCRLLWSHCRRRIGSHPARG